MGLDFIREKSQAFVQKRDSSKFQELDVADLLSRLNPDEFVQHYRCLLADKDTQLTEGLGLIGRACSEREVQISQRGKAIGNMLPEDAVKLTALMKANHRYGGVITLILEQPADLSGVFLVTPKRPLKRTP